jgi:hypothetical protein
MEHVKIGKRVYARKNQKLKEFVVLMEVEKTLLQKNVKK